ncbi:MAG: KAP family P-loop NTPase fold protein [Candidatus Methanospirareceae archaeon]
MASKYSDVAVRFSEEDKLGFKDYADGVIDIIENISKEDTPFTIGIFGSWGSGKTSFMQIMENILQSMSYETVFFKSWEYGNEEKPWIPFMIKVVDKLFEKEIDKKKLIRKIFLFSTDVVLQTYSQGRVSTGGILDSIRKVRKTTPFREWSDEDAEVVIERVTKIEEFKNSITERAEESKKGKIVIFIDDLDRIPEKIVDFLNSLKTFLDIGGCIFVMGCDYEILKDVLEQRYEGKIYEDYFDKIVQTEFYIPKISEQAIQGYLQFLTGWNDDDIGECTQLVIYSIGGNPRKIKRVVNATMLIKSVFEKRLATFLQAFENPRDLEREISKIFTPAEVFDLLFDKKMLFKLVCVREQWFTYYEKILIDEEKQQGLFNTSKEQGNESKNDVGDLAAIKFMKEDSPEFQGLGDLKTYLTLLGISSPEAGIPIKPAEPADLPIELFNRYMLFERIDTGKVEETIITEKIERMEWEANLSSYHFFIEVISAFGYDNLLRNLFKKDKIQSIAERIKERSSEPKAIKGLLDSVRAVDNETAKRLLNETQDTYSEKIRASRDPGAIGWLLESVGEIDAETARELLNETKDVYAEKIKASRDPKAIGVLLGSVRDIDEDAAKKLLNETQDTYSEKIRASTNLWVIGWLLNSVRGIDAETARELLNETKDVYAEKIKASRDPRAIGVLLARSREVDNETAKRLLNETKDAITEKIKASGDPMVIRLLLNSERRIDNETAKRLLNETKDAIAEGIRSSRELWVIGWLLKSVRLLDEETAKRLLNETGDAYAEKIRANRDPVEIRWLLESVREIDNETAKRLLNETKDAIAEGMRAVKAPEATGRLLDNVRMIDEDIAEWLEKETS